MDADLYALMRRLENEHWWFVARRSIIETLLKRIDLPQEADILEVGCGTGGNLAMLMRFGKVTGVERDQFAIELARKRNIANVFPGELPNGIPEFEGQFDLITLFDVIEHVEKDLDSLVALSSLLNPGGRMVITVPAFNFLWSRHDEENQHKRRYHRRHLESLGKQANFNVDYISYFNTWLFLPVAFVRLLRKLVPYSETWKDMRMPMPLINRVLTGIFSSERHAVGQLRLPFGISLVAVLSLSTKALDMSASNNLPHHRRNL